MIFNMQQFSRYFSIVLTISSWRLERSCGLFLRPSLSYCLILSIYISSYYSLCIRRCWYLIWLERHWSKCWIRNGLPWHHVIGKHCCDTLPGVCLLEPFFQFFEISRSLLRWIRFTFGISLQRIIIFVVCHFDFSLCCVAIKHYARICERSS